MFAFPLQETPMALWLFAACALKPTVLPPPPFDSEVYSSAVDWDATGSEAASILSGYIQVDTVNPPGNETRGAEFLGSLLAAEGIPYEIHESAPGRGNLVARLEGAGEEKPLCLLSHIDVVTYEAEKWPEGRHPLSGYVDSDGVIWGRGALDMKGMGVMELMSMVLVKRMGIPLRRDLILIAVADEEIGGSGIQHMVDTYWPYLECGHLVNEGGLGLEGMLVPGQTVYPISVGEKGNVWIRMWAYGLSGHGSTPRPGEAPARLLEALEALEARKISAGIGPEMGQLLANVGHDAGGAAGFVLKRPWLASLFVQPKLMSNPLTRAALIDTVHVTGFGGAKEPNVVPSEVFALLDCRIQPGVDPEAFTGWLEEIVGDDIRLEVITARAGNLSPYDDPLYHALARHAVAGEPNSVAGPVISVGFTDSIFVRPMGTRAYGFVPVVLTEEEMSGFHGAGERLPQEQLQAGVRKLFSAIVEVSAAQ
jgi:acetylornithine deacetylase/succinyl-diaminopimelate desuccinylase-like protein